MKRHDKYETERLSSGPDLDVPVVLMIFNRPEKTEKVFNEIAKIKPRQLFVIADGPRPERPDDKKRCASTRAVIDRVDWDCEVLRNYSDTNMRGPWRISSGLDWVFSQVEEAIILEDDCVPAPSFFSFCKALLKRYRHDERIMHISGTNFIDKIENSDRGSYYFSKYTFNWGWATWRRAWKYFDLSFSSWPEVNNGALLQYIFDSESEYRYWTRHFENVYTGTSVHWDYAWMYAVWSQGGLSIIPKRNLISNIGYGMDAVHALSENDPRINKETSDLREITHPKILVRDALLDVSAYQQIFKPKSYVELSLLAIREKRFLKSLANFIRQKLRSR